MQGRLLNALPHPVLAVAADGFVVEANVAAEIFFGISRSILLQQTLANLLPFDSVLLALVEQVKATVLRSPNIVSISACRGSVRKKWSISSSRRCPISTRASSS